MDRVFGEVTPLEYLQRTGASYKDLSMICGYDYDTVKRWFFTGKNRRNPPIVVCRLLALELELNELKRQKSTC